MAQLSLACIALSRSQRELLLSLRVAYKHEKKNTRSTVWSSPAREAYGVTGVFAQAAHPRETTSSREERSHSNMPAPTSAATAAEPRALRASGTTARAAELPDEPEPEEPPVDCAFETVVELKDGAGFDALLFVSMNASAMSRPMQDTTGVRLNAGWCASASGRM